MGKNNKNKRENIELSFAVSGSIYFEVGITAWHTPWIKNSRKVLCFGFTPVIY